MAEKGSKLVEENRKVDCRSKKGSHDLKATVTPRTRAEVPNGKLLLRVYHLGGNRITRKNTATYTLDQEKAIQLQAKRFAEGSWNACPFGLILACVQRRI